MSDATVRSFRRRGGRLAEVPSSLGSVAVEPRLAVEMAQLHGLLQYDTDARVGHVPFMLTPYALKPAQLASLQRWTPLFNRLVWKLGADRAFLRDLLEPCAEADPFLARLLAILPAAARDLQPARIVLLRSDYLMERTSERADAAPGEAAGETTKEEESSSFPPSDRLVPRQVELNTIAASYAGLGQMLQRVHEILLAGPLAENLVPNRVLSRLAGHFAAAMKAYSDSSGLSSVWFLTIVQPRERNVFDQRLLELALWRRGIQTLRLPLSEVFRRGRLKEGHLWIEGRPVALTYFRAAYGPEDYPDEDAYRARELIENSSTMAIPTLSDQLVGAKKVQQVLTDPAVLGRFLAASEAQEVRRSFMPQYDLDASVEGPGGQTESVAAWALRDPSRFVLKPQREGGGHNLYDDDLRRALLGFSAAERRAHVLMARIGVQPHAGKGMMGESLKEGDFVSEVGCFGLLRSVQRRELANEHLGHLVRSKPLAARETGVAAGYGLLNTLVYSRQKHGN